MQKNKEIILNNLNTTHHFAKDVLKILPKEQCLLFLKGDLGSGKTTWAQFLLKELGYTGKVKSPTYSLIELYITPTRTVYHMDLYRIKDPEELYFTGIMDHLNENALFLIEWPEKLEALGISAYLTLKFKLKQTGGQFIYSCLSE
jgi:tRNA threonylcarbamoyladenosine biosynthesis protein TsaE